MAFLFMRRNVTLTSVLKSHFKSNFCCFSSGASKFGNNDSAPGSSFPNQGSEIHLSPLFSDGKPRTHGFDIEVVDTDSWRVSSGLSHVWKENLATSQNAGDRTVASSRPIDQNDPDFDEIEEMRIRGTLYYKLDRDSKEFEEYNYEFRGKKGTKTRKNQKENKNQEQKESRNQDQDHQKTDKKMSAATSNAGLMDKSIAEKKKKRTRTLTYNQLTGPYHEPFCLDIYISKGSVRACIVHRATSNVVAVAHSISKDMKYDLGSVRDSKACAAVGSILAQRALDDDIHDVIYTPRKGEKLEGKLQIVLQAVIDNGVNVKVKIKRRMTKSGRPFYS